VVEAVQRARSERSSARAVRRRWNLARRRISQSETDLVVLLLALSLTIGALCLHFHGTSGFSVPITALVIPMVLADLLLSPRWLPWVIVFILAELVAVVFVTVPDILISRRIGALVTDFTVGVIILIASFRRIGLGVAGSRGESMLVDLRDRISKQSVMPALPPGWYGEIVMRSAGGSKFAGDFMVATKSADGNRLQTVVVDVSGKGEQAGTRSLLLSGAFGGLLGALPAERFLPAANEYLLAQDWSEGFATAVHLSIDLRTGVFELRSAGHPPAVQLKAGSGRWAVHETEGPVLGLMPDAEYAVTRGVLGRGDALLLYTDGLVETPRRDIALGIDRLLGESERLLRVGFEKAATRLVDSLDKAHDDQALLLLHRG